MRKFLDNVSDNQLIHFTMLGLNINRQAKMQYLIFSLIDEKE